MKAKSILVCFLYLGLAAPAARAQAVQTTIQRLDVSNLPEIECYFTVTDQANKSILGLSGEELEILIDGVVQKNVRLRSALGGDEFLAVTLLFDRSGSMKDVLTQIKNAATDFVDRMSQDDLLAVISFDDRVRVDSDLTRDRTLVRNAIASIQPGKNTALFDAIQEALGILESVSTRRRAILVFSDGKDTRSQGTREDILEKAKSQGIPLYFIGLGESVDEDGLILMSKETGGHFFKAARPGEFLLLYQTIADQLENQYLVKFTSSFGTDAQWHDLEIRFKTSEKSAWSAQRKFVASRGPGVQREALAGIQRRSEDRRLLAWVAVGSFLGLLLGLILITSIKLLRKDIPLLSPLVFGVLVSAMLFGAVLGAIAALMA